MGIEVGNLGGIYIIEGFGVMFSTFGLSLVVIFFSLVDGEVEGCG